MADPLPLSGPLPLAGVMELRVHGVSGTPPEELLDRPLVEQVAGDRIAGFHRPRLAVERKDTGPDPFATPQPRAPELYSYNWGGLTSGTAARALWLLLIPLTLVNVAPRARPAGATATAPATRWLWFTCRLLALTLTCLYVLTGVGVGMDLVAWQCSGGSTCAGAAPDFVFHGLSSTHRFSVEHMLLLGLCVPLLQLGIVAAVARRTSNRYEKTVVDFGAEELSAHRRRPGSRLPAEVPLDSPDMWRNAAPVARLRSLHLQVGVAVVLWSVVATTGDLWWGLVPAGVAGYGVVALGRHSFTAHAPAPRWTLAGRVVWGVLAAASAVQLTGLSLDHHWVDDRRLAAGRTPAGGLPHFVDTALWVSALTAIALVAVVVAVVVTRRAGVDPPGETGAHHRLRPALAGLGTAAFAALGTFLAATISAGTYMYAATWLDTGSLRPSYRDLGYAYVHFDVPAVVAVANLALTFGVAVLVLVVIIAGADVARRYLRTPGGDAALAADYGSEATAVDPGRALAIRRAMLLGRLVDGAGGIIGALVIAGAAVVGWLGVRMVLDGGRAPRTVVGTIADGWLSAPALGAVGTSLAVFLLVGLVSLGGLAFRTRAVRRTVGILWDVAAFWPRLCHPLAAPCYAERTVPDIVTYVSAYRAAHPDDGVVLAAHSQGTVISAAVIQQLQTWDARTDGSIRVVPRLAFLSFGCVLRRLYGRYFPAWFGPARLHELERCLTAPDADVPRWRNLWRYTDYLGGQVTAGPEQVVTTTPVRGTAAPVLIRTPQAGPVEWEWHCPDPPAFRPRPGDTTYAAPGRHSNFWGDPSGYFQLAAADLAESVRARR